MESFRDPRLNFPSLKQLATLGRYQCPPSICFGSGPVSYEGWIDVWSISHEAVPSPALLREIRKTQAQRMAEMAQNTAADAFAAAFAGQDDPAALLVLSLLRLQQLRPQNLLKKRGNGARNLNFDSLVPTVAFYELRVKPRKRSHTKRKGRNPAHLSN